MEEKKYDYRFKIQLLGESGVGKSSLIQRFIEGNFQENLFLFTDFRIKFLNIENKIIKSQFWEYSSGERFRIIPPSYYRTTHGFIVIYDISNKYSFNQIRKWLEQIELYSPPEARKILIGNKNDKNSEREISEEEGKNLANEFNMNFFETSAKTGYNVNEAFEFLVWDIFENYKTFNENTIKLKKNDKIGKNKNCNK